MDKFNNEVFESLVSDLINDTFYTENISIRGKISTVRQYSEVIIRRILDISNEDFVTVGDKKIREQIIDKSNNNPILLNALKNIQKKGNASTHTQNTKDFTLDDLNSIIDSLFDLYAYLFIDYFEHYEFGKNQNILASFSILPPIIRYKTLSYLYDKTPQNISLIDKFVLSILKAFNIEKAFEWLDEKKMQLEKLKVYTAEAENALQQKLGLKLAKKIINAAPENMYIMCYEKVESVTQTIEKNGRLYNNFEEAKNFYVQKGIVSGDSEEINLFNSIMEFCYMGRKETKTNYGDINKYTIMNITNADA